jgi:magnesium-transporting ATPase (P-type)
LKPKTFSLIRVHSQASRFRLKKRPTRWWQTHQTSLTGLTNMLFAGTSVTTGSGQALVVKTGMQTEFSHIVTSLGQSR